MYQIAYPNYEIIVVDNGSSDKSLPKIRDYANGTLEVNSPFFNYDPFSKPIAVTEYTKEEAESSVHLPGQFPSTKKQLTIIKNDRNYGYAEGNNIGIRMALARGSDYVLLLNNDVVVDPAFLTELVLAAERDEHIGFIGPKAYFYDYFGRTDVIHFAGGIISLGTASARLLGYKQIDRGQFDELQFVDFISGACLLAKKETVLRTGPLRADYFAYWEDVEWCLRGAKLDYKSAYTPNARIWHKIGASKKEKSSTAYYYFGRNFLWLAKEYAGGAQLILVISFFLTIRIWAEMGKSIILHKNINEPISFLRGTLDGLRRH
jgi:GT2 family glycosyltransferase